MTGILNAASPIRATALAAVALLLGSSAGCAQSFWMQSIPVWSAQQALAPSTPATAPRETRRRLPASIASFRLNGEEPNATWPIYVTAQQATAKARFELATTTSVSVTPEDGTIAVSVNGARLKVTALGRPYSLRTVGFDIPAGVLVAGWNAIGIAAHHRHRVDCSVDATEELWTRIDSAGTGLRFADGADGGPVAIGDLAAISPRYDGAVSINVARRENSKLTPKAIERISRAITNTALAGHFTQPVVGFGDAAQDGLDLAIGTTAELADTPDLLAIGKVAGPLISLLPATGPRNPRLVVTGTTEAELDAAIGQLAATEPVGTPEGLRALQAAEGFPVGADGQSFSLHDLGVADQDVTGRTSRVGFVVNLPADFLPADYGRVSIDFAGGYAAGLQPEAQVVVAINGRSAGSVRLAAARGETFRHKRMFVPLSGFQPGQNRIEIQIDAPDASDRVCDTSSPADTRARFWLSAATRLSFPPLARVGRLPDLSMTASGGFPYSSAHGEMTLVVPTPDRLSMSAALTMMTRLGVAAGRPLSFSFAVSQPPRATGNIMIIAPARALDPTRMREAQLDPDTVKQAWSVAASAPSASERPILPASLRRRATQGDWPETCAIAPKTAPRSDPGDDLTGSIVVPGLDFRDMLDSRIVAPIRLALGYPGSAKPQEITTRLQGASLVVSQAARATDPNAVLTIVTSPTAALLNSSIACLVSPRVWTNLSGNLSSLDGSTGEVTSHRPDSVRYIDSGAFSFRNERLKIAGLLSLNPGIFALIALLLVGPLAFATHHLVRKLGRDNG